MTGDTVTVDNSRRTRSERQAQTRLRLIEDARDMFLADGYAATSLDKVALRAGFSKGAVYSNFAGKEELCMAVLDSIHQQQLDGVVAAFAGGGDLDARIDAFADWAREGLGQPRWTALESEFGAVARHSPYVAGALKARHREILETIETLIREVITEADVELRMPPDRAATAMLSLGIGLGALRSIDHTVDVSVFADAMRSMMRGTRTA